METVAYRINHGSHIIWGAMVDETIPKNKVKAMVVVAGGRFPYLEEGGKEKPTIDLGIEFTE